MIFQNSIKQIVVPISYIFLPIGSMVLLYMVTCIPSIYPLYVSIYTSTMDPSWDLSIVPLGFPWYRCRRFRCQMVPGSSLEPLLWLPWQLFRAGKRSWAGWHGERMTCWNRLESPFLMGKYGKITIFYGKTMENYGKLPFLMVKLQKTMENHHAINGKTHYFYGH